MLGAALDVDFTCELRNQTQNIFHAWKTRTNKKKLTLMKNLIKAVFYKAKLRLIEPGFPTKKNNLSQQF